MRVQGGSIDWSVIMPFMTTSLLVGLRAGTRLAGTKDPGCSNVGSCTCSWRSPIYTAGRSLVAIL